MIAIYGIKNCNTMQKAFAWFETHKLSYTFHDYKKDGAQIEDLKRWSEKAGWEKLLNKSGLTWKKQDLETQKNIVDQDSAIRFLLKNPSAIKRPVIERNDMLLIGFNEEDLQRSFIR
jgi:Spx/MgsR family transcriptional regulator